MYGYKKSSVAVGLAALAAIGAAVVWADSASDNLRSAPEAVQAAVVKLAGTNKITEFDKETEAGKTIYDLEYKVGGAEYAADIDPSGAILEREVDVDLSFVPPAVIAAAKKAHADGKLSESSIATDGKQLYFGIDVKVGKDTHEMNIDVTGNILKDTIEPPEEPESPAAGGKEDKD